MVSEFSNYDRVWKRRLWIKNPNEQFLYKLENLVPRRLRRAVTFYGTYLVHRDAVKYGAVSFVEWVIFSKQLGLSIAWMLIMMQTTSFLIAMDFRLHTGGW